MILVVMLLADVGSRGKGKFLMMGKYSRIQHHFSKGHSKGCTDMLSGGGYRHQICGCILTSTTALGEH